MKTPSLEELDIRALMREVGRYLAAVDTFRAEGREPTWLVEHERGPERVSRRRPLPLAAPPIP